MSEQVLEQKKVTADKAERVCRLSYGGETRAGSVGLANQDSIALLHPESRAFAQKGALFVVADGLGGYAGGDVASAMVCRELPGVYYQMPAGDCAAANLRHAVLQMNESLYAASNAPGENHGMCTTIVAAVVRDHAVSIVHVGDSKGYVIRRGTIVYATTDHAVHVPTFDLGGRRFLTQSLGAQEHVNPAAINLRVMPGDLVLLCTDGLTDALPLQELLRHSSLGAPSETARSLVAAARERGGTDDISVIVVKVAE